MGRSIGLADQANGRRAGCGTALEVGVDVVQYRGWYETPTFWGPKFWKQYLRPCIEEQSRLVRSAGKLVSYLLPEGQGVYAEDLRDTHTYFSGLTPRCCTAVI